jgi:hypothetical protein
VNRGVDVGLTNNSNEVGADYLRARDPHNILPKIIKVYTDMLTIRGRDDMKIFEINGIPQIIAGYLV